MGFLSGAMGSVAKGILGGGGAQAIGGGISSIVGGFLAKGSIRKAVKAYREFSEGARDEEVLALEAALSELEQAYPEELRELRRQTETLRNNSGHSIKVLRKALPQATEGGRALRREVARDEGQLSAGQRTALEDLSRENAASLASAGGRAAGRAGIAAKFDAERRFRENALDANRQSRLGAASELGRLEHGVRSDIAGVRERLGGNLANVYAGRQDVMRRRGLSRSGTELGKGEAKATHKLRMADLEFGGALAKGRANQQIAGGAIGLGTQVLGGAAQGMGIFEQGGPVQQTGPALVHQGEHVFTDEAVRGAGGGNPRLGHMKLEELMEDLESRGDPGSMGTVGRMMTENRKSRLRRTSVD